MDSSKITIVLSLILSKFAAFSFSLFPSIAFGRNPFFFAIIYYIKVCFFEHLCFVMNQRAFNPLSKDILLNKFLHQSQSMFPNDLGA